MPASGDLWARFVTEFPEDQKQLGQLAQQHFNYRPIITNFGGNVQQVIKHRLGEASSFARCAPFLTSEIPLPGLLGLQPFNCCIYGHSSWDVYGADIMHRGGWYWGHVDLPKKKFNGACSLTHINSPYGAPFPHAVEDALYSHHRHPYQESSPLSSSNIHCVCSGQLGWLMCRWNIANTLDEVFTAPATVKLAMCQESNLPETYCGTA